MNLLHNLKNLFHVLIIFQCLFFLFYLLSRKHRKRPANIILAAFLFVLAFIELGGVFAHFLDLKRYLLAHIPRILYIDFPFPFLAAPLLYFYVLSLARRDFRLKKAHLFHLVPFVFFVVLILFRYHLHSAETLRQMLKDGSLFDRLEGLIYSLLAYLQFLAYSLASFAVLRLFRRNLRDVYSTVERINLSWLKFVLTGLVAVKSLEMIELGLWFATGDMKVVVLYYLAQIVFIVFLAVMFFKGLRQPEVFAVAEEANHQRKYEKALLSKEQKEEYAKKLEFFMETEKPYLDPLLSLGGLAKKVAIPVHHLSQVLNTHFGQNFFDFINSYRIKESRRLLVDPNNGKRTVLQVVYGTGFNSKSVFNTAFKKHTGMTPSQFRKQQG